MSTLVSRVELRRVDELSAELVLYWESELFQEKPYESKMYVWASDFDPKTLRSLVGLTLIEANDKIRKITNQEDEDDNAGNEGTTQESEDL